MAAFRTSGRVPRSLRSTESRDEKRKMLRLRAPQVGDVPGTPPDADSDSESEDDSDAFEDEDESDDDTDNDEPERIDLPASNPAGEQPTAPGFVTLVPPGSPSQDPDQPPASETADGPRSTLNPIAEESSTTDVPSLSVGPPESIVNSVPESESTTFVSSTITNDPGSPSETSVSRIDDAESFISDTSLIASTTADPTSVPTEDVEQVGSSNGGSGLNRGADVGIIIGTMALAAMIIAGCVLWYRRRTMRKANDGHLARLDEKPLPITPEDGGNGGPNRTQFSSWANFIHPKGGDAGAQGGEGFYAGNEKGPQPVTPLSPSAPPTAYGAAGAFRSLTGQEAPPHMTSRYGGGGPVEGRLVPPPTHLAPPPRTDIYPPGQVPIPQDRVQSMARTEVTDSTEGTWRTWGVDQRPTKGKTSQRRYLG